VERSAARRVASGCVLLVAVLGGCGYQLAHAPRDEAGPFAVVGGRAYTPHASMMDSVEAGARSELARAGQLASCAPSADGATSAPCPAILLEILRVDEEAAGLRIDRLPVEPGVPGVSGVSGVPAIAARAVRITVTGRARVRAGAEGVALRDTGDMSTTDVFARPEDPAAAAAARDQAGRLVSRRLGERLVRRLLGLPEPTFE
jgi:hypothetical protein